MILAARRQVELEYHPTEQGFELFGSSPPNDLKQRVDNRVGTVRVRSLLSLRGWIQPDTLAQQ